MNMNRPDKAKLCFLNGFNCAQAILSSYAEEYGLNPDIALKVSTAFGSGIAKRGEMCGAVIGALMVIGLCKGRYKIEDLEAKADTLNISDEFLFRFKQEFGSLNCRDLVGCDPSTPEGLQKIKETNSHQLICPKFIYKTALILEEILFRSL